MRSLAVLLLVSCNVVEPPDEPEPIECDVEPVEISLPESAREDEEACPQDVDGKPWEAVCGRGYMTEQKQVDGRFEWVCTRARDCQCLDKFIECGYELEKPGYCAYQDQD